MLYRILTENKNKENIVKLVSEVFEGFTVYEGIGYWKHTKEDQLTIEIDTFNDVAWLNVLKIARLIKDVNSQESVLIQELKSDSRLI